jgi:chromosome partitioning protein
MLTYTTYTEAGGVGKTTLTAALLEAHADHDREVLAIDLDPQNGSLTYLLGVDAPREDSQADTIARHMAGIPNGSFDGLAQETAYGIDLVPSHNMLEDLGALLDDAENRAADPEAFARYDQLRRVLIEADAPDRYDTIVIDPPASTGPHLYNAVGATRALVVPVEATAKGLQSVEGLEDAVGGLADELDATIGVLAVVPIGVGRTTDEERYQERLADLGYPAPVTIRTRNALFGGCWDQQCPPAHYVDAYRDYPRDHETETLEKIAQLARSLEEGQ